MKSITNNPIFKVAKPKRLLPLAPRVVWTQRQEAKLKQIVAKNEAKNWKKIAEEMKETFHDRTLTAKKCRERWCNCSNPILDKGALNTAEELLLLAYHKQYGTKWSTISKKLTSRSSIKMKNEFTNLVRKTARKIKLGDINGLNSAVLLIQALYITILINELISLNEFSETKLVVSAFIYEIVKEKDISQKECLNFIEECINMFLEIYKESLTLQNLTKMKEVTVLRSFIYKILEMVETNCSHLSELSENYLIDIMESVLLKDSFQMTPLTRTECLSACGETCGKEEFKLNGLITEDYIDLNKEVITSYLDCWECNFNGSNAQSPYLAFNEGDKEEFNIMNAFKEINEEPYIEPSLILLNDSIDY